MAKTKCQSLSEAAIAEKPSTWQKGCHEPMGLIKSTIAFHSLHGTSISDINKTPL